MATKKKAPEMNKVEPDEAPLPTDLVKCINCEVMLPKHTDTCPNCSYRQPHPGWS